MLFIYLEMSVNIKSTNMTDWWEHESLIKIPTPTTMLVCGPTMSGKSVFTSKLIRQADYIFEKTPRKIIYAYSVWQPIFDELEKSSSVTFHEGLPTKDNLQEWWIDNIPILLILDDLLDSACNSTDIQQLFTVGCHHHNTTVIFISQNIFSKGKCMRTISLNVHFIVLFKNRRDEQQIYTLARQIFPTKVRYFMQAYEMATTEKYSYLLIDLSPHTDKKYQLRSCIFKGEDVRIFLPV